MELAPSQTEAPRAGLVVGPLQKGPSKEIFQNRLKSKQSNIEFVVV